MESSGTVVMMSRQHGDRWSAFTDHAGVQDLSSLLRADQLKKIDILQELDDEFLNELSTDITLAKWHAGAIVFQEGTYLDVAFYVLEGEVDLELNSNERIKVQRGDFFGEIGAMVGWAQTVTARTAAPTTLLQIRVAGLRKLRRKARKLKQRLDDVYRTRTLKHHLTSTPLLQACSPSVINQLAERVDFVSHGPDEIVVKEGDPVEHLIMVRAGSLKLTQRVGYGDVTVSYVRKGGTLGESELLVDDLGVWQSTATSVGHCELVRIPKDDLLQLTHTMPELQKQLWAGAMDRIKDIGSRRNNLERADLLDFTLAKGLTQANSFLALDLEKCVRCDDCVRGCATTHGGTPRFVREGEVYEGYLIVRSCYHCQDPLCLVGCPTGAIKRINVGDTVEIDPSICIGCGACAENCAYDSIVMNDLGVTWGADAVPKRLRGTPKVVASKCDLCHSAPEGPACVSSCPHGAAYRVSGAEQFDVLLQAKRRGAA